MPADPHALEARVPAGNDAAPALRGEPHTNGFADGRDGSTGTPASSASTGAAPASLPASLPAAGFDLKGAVADWERSLVIQALERTDGNQSGAARLLGLTRDELRYRVEKYALTDD